MQIKKWSVGEKIVFRFFLCFFVIHQLFSPDLYLFLFGFNVKILDWFDQLYQPLFEYLNATFLHVTQSDGRLKVNDFLFEIMAILMALVLSLLWGFVDRKRSSYNQANFWLQHFLRYSLSIILFAYGMDKLVPIQMPIPTTTALDMPIGYFRPGDVFWKLMGSQTLYQSFSGLAEIIGALLLLFSRTKVIGLLIILGTLINIIMLNIGFDIGVTYYVINLLIVCVYLLLPYLKSIVQFFLFKEKVQIYESPKYTPTALTGLIYKIPIIFFFISAFFSIKNPIIHYKETSAINQSKKHFDVVTQINNLDTIKMVLGDTMRWKYVTTFTKDQQEYATITTMGIGHSYNYLLKKDTVNQIVQFFNEKNEKEFTFTFTTNAVTGEQSFIDKSQKLKFVLNEYSNEDWPLLKKRNKFLPFE